MDKKSNTGQLEKAGPAAEFHNRRRANRQIDAFHNAGNNTSTDSLGIPGYLDTSERQIVLTNVPSFDPETGLGVTATGRLYLRDDVSEDDDPLVVNPITAIDEIDLPPQGRYWMRLCPSCGKHEVMVHRTHRMSIFYCESSETVIIARQRSRK